MSPLMKRRDEGHPLSLLQREMNRVFQGFFDDDWMVAPFNRLAGWAPALDVAETDDAVVVKAEIPGMESKDLDISMSGDVLTLKGEKKEEKEEKTKTFHRVERSYGAFSRSVRMPCPVDAGKVEATYKDGVLRISLPKKEEAKTRSIAVKVAE